MINTDLCDGTSPFLINNIRYIINEWAIFHSRLLNNQRVTLGNHKSYIYIFKGLRLTAERRPSNDFWHMVWEDWAEILRANPGRPTPKDGKLRKVYYATGGWQ